MALRTCSKCSIEKPVSDFAKCRGYADGYYRQCKQCRGELTTAWSKKNKDHHALLIKQWSLENIERRREIRRNWARKHRLQRTVEERLRDNMRQKVWEQLKGVKNRRSTFAILGYDLSQLKIHLESKFQQGMTWDNYGQWHIDHIRPLASFQIIGECDLRECWALSNLQPLWASDNLKKRDLWTKS